MPYRLRCVGPACSLFVQGMRPSFRPASLVVVSIFSEELPEGWPSFVKRGAVFAGFDTWFVFVRTGHQSVFRATVLNKIVLVDIDVRKLLFDTMIFQVPFSHLLEEEKFVVFILGPAHVKNVGMLLALKHFPQKLASAAVKVIASWEVVFVSTQYLDA